MLTGAALVALSILAELPWWVTALILLREIGIEGGDIQKLVGNVSGAHAALPPAAPHASPANKA